jgi:hypothetical protein
MQELLATVELGCKQLYAYKADKTRELFKERLTSKFLSSVEWNSISSDKQLSQSVRKHEVEPVFTKVICLYIASAVFLAKGLPDKGFDLAKDMFKTLKDFLKENPEEVWFMPMFKTFTVHFTDCAIQDDNKRSSRKPEGGIGSSVRSRQQSMTSAVQDLQVMIRTLNQNKKVNNVKNSQALGVPVVVNSLFRLFFVMNSLKHVKTTIRCMKDYESKLNVFQLSDTVTYKYYCGRYRLLEENYLAAKADLEFAFKSCHNQHRANQLAILRSLIPLKILNGEYPKPSFFKQYNLPILREICQAISNGNIKAFTDALETHEQMLIDCGIFLVVDKLESVVWRRFLEIVHKTQKAFTKRPTVLKLELISIGLERLGVDIDPVEVECILAKLIFIGYVKGYIAHKNALVLSAKIPFPPLNLRS